MAGASACGGGGDTGGQAGQLAFRVRWEQPSLLAGLLAGQGAAVDSTANVFATPIPPAVNAIRFTYAPENDDDYPACCIAIVRGSDAFENRRLSLADVPEGPGTLGVTGFATDFAPADGPTRLCPTRPAGQGVACDATRRATASYRSDALLLDVAAGEVNEADVEVYSVPFLVSADPAEGETASDDHTPVEVVVGDAANSVDPNVRIDLSRGALDFDVDIVAAEPCDDGSAVPGDRCSVGGVLAVTGVVVSARSATPITEGPVDVRVRADNDATPPRSLDFEYGILAPFSEPTTTLGSTTTTTVTTTSTTDTTVTSEFPTTSTTIVPDTSTTTTTTLPPTTTTSTTSTTTTTSTTSTTTTSTTSTTTTTEEPLVPFCVNFGVVETIDLLGVAFRVDYSTASLQLMANDTPLECFSTLGGVVEAYQADDAIGLLEAAVAVSEPFSAPAEVVTCIGGALASNLPMPQDFAIEVTEAVAADLEPADVTVAVVDFMCPI